MIYLDYAATTPVRDEVVQTIQEALIESFGNPSSTYRIGKSTKYLLTQARKSLANLLNVSEHDIFFTSGATESNNWAIRSQAELARKLGKGNHIIVSAIEHPSVMETLVFLEQEGFEITYIHPNSDGEVTAAAFVKATKDQTIGWVAMAVNNEVGSILPVFELGELAREKSLWFHVDAVQALGHLDWDYSELACTSFVGSGHKFYAPKGIGFMVYQPWDKQMKLTPLIFGGGQEANKRSGTENIPYVLGMVRALELLAEAKNSILEHHNDLQNYLYDQLNQHQIAFERNGNPKAKVPYIHNIWLKDLMASQLLILMDLAGIYISAGSACSAGSLTDSKILKAYYPETPERWSQSIRLSFGKESTKADIDKFIIQIKKFIERK